jgi:hypothetical protein
MQAFDASGAALGTTSSSGAAPGAPETLELDAAQIATVTFSGGGGEGVLIELCITRSGSGASRPPASDPHDLPRPTPDTGCGCGGRR